MKVERSGMWSRYVVLSVLLAVCGTAWAQRGQLRIQVLDSLELSGVPDVEVTWGSGQRIRTDGEGRCVVEFRNGESFTLHFARTGYRKKDRLFDQQGSNTRDELRILLVPIEFELPSVPVTRAKPEVIFQRADVHAADLLINDEGLWVLAYKHPRMLREEAEAGEEILRDVRLVLLDTLFHEVTRCSVPEEVKGLRRDPANAVLIEGTTQAFSIARMEEGGLLLVPFGLEDLRQRVLPWTDTLAEHILGTNADRVMPRFDHLAYDPRSDSANVVCTVVDTFMMQLFRSEYKYLKGPEKVVAMNLASELGVDKEVVAGYMSGFQHNLWFKPVYGPLFVVGDTLLVFDHAKARLRKFTRDFREAGSALLSYLNKIEGRDWSGKLLQDRATQKLYAIFDRNGFFWLRPIDPVTGALGDRRRITYKYPERVQVYNDAVWYIYRPQESLQKRSIYREKL
ncbi:MAG: hypothetical protein IPO90_10005 [Flavobacteriales bacterium]|nr:hypothetical protein [Flavobacteriales bacterium]